MERGVGLGFGSWGVASRGRRWIARSADQCFSLDLIYSVFKQPCSARVIQQGTFHSPNDGQAYVLFQTQAAADQAVQRIDEGCLILPSGRNHQLSNREINVADISKFKMEGSYYRIISIEMFEHMKNYKELLKKISSWMNQDSLLFVRHFCHKAFPYDFKDINEDDWITIYFFSGGTMPSANLHLYFQEDLPSSSSRLKAHFVGMGYSATLVDKVIKEHGQRDENLILEALFGYTDINEDDWITIYFFSGGTMPSAYLHLYFQEDLPSSSSRLKALFVGMGYSATLVDKVIKEHGWLLNRDMIHCLPLFRST